jgi:anti-anti-sigma factor
VIQKEPGSLSVTYTFEEIKGQNALVVTVDPTTLTAVRDNQIFSLVLETLLEEPQALVVDLQKVKMISSLGLGAVVNAIQKAGDLGRKLYFRVSPEVRKAFSVTSLDEKANLLE